MMYMGYKVVFVVVEYDIGLYKSKIIGEFDVVEDALNVANSNCRIEVELRDV